MNFKKLKERRAVLAAQMKALLEKAETEERALDEAETEEFGNCEKEIQSIDATLQAEERARGFFTEEKEEKLEERAEEEVEAAEERAFDNYIRGIVEERADVTMTKSENGAIIPNSIAKKIISKVVDICPIYKDAERYNVAGTLTIPYYDEKSGKITMSYATEGEDGESTSGKFKNISLTGFLGRAITDVSKSLINNSDFDLTSFVIQKMAEAIAQWLEHELLIGTSGKIEGLSGVKQLITAAKAKEVTADELIELQEEVPDVYQTNAYWIMNKATRKAIRKLKDGEGNYLLNKDASARWNYTLLGKDVYTSDNMPEMAAGKTAIYYGDMTGLAVKVSEDVSIEVLRETKARQHLVEVLGFVEVDAKVQDEQKIAGLKMATA